MRKIILSSLLILAGTVGAIGLAWAAYDDVQFTADTEIMLEDGVSTARLTVTSTSNVASFIAGTSTITLGLESGSTLTLMGTSSNKRYMYDSQSAGTFTCNTNDNTSTIRFSSASTQTTIISLGDFCISNFAAQSNGQTGINLTWSGSSTAYTILNTTGGGSSSVATPSTESYTVTGLNCGSTYSFSVKGTTGSVDSNTVTVSGSTQSCANVGGSGGSGSSGGGSVSPAPVATPTPTSIPTTSTVPIATGPNLSTFPAECQALKAGELFKVDTSPAIYLVVDMGNGKLGRKAFPYSWVYFTWFPDYSKIKTTKFVSGCVDGFSNLGFVNPRPGSYLVKSTVSPNVYAIGPGNLKHKIPSEAVAAALYGPNWNKGITKDYADVFDASLKLGTPIVDAPHNGQLLKVSGKTGVYFVMDNKLSSVEGTLLSYLSVDIRTVAQTTLDTLVKVTTTVLPAKIVENPSQ